MRRGPDTSAEPSADGARANDRPRRDEYAVIDLGSNSFHLHVVRVLDGESRYLDRYRDAVRLADGLRADGTIDPAKQEQALAVIRRYGERIAGFPAENVRAIGTSAFRHARKATAFVRRAEHALGRPIDIISGREEARLIYLGIITEEQPKANRRFIVDIGGGSSEFIYGEGRKPVCIDSVNIGNISLSRSVFDGRALTDELFRSTASDVSETLRGTDVYRRRGSFQITLGASGTLRLIAELISNLGIGSELITREAFDQLCERFVVRGERKPFLKAGLLEQRLRTFPGALAILAAIFDAFSLKQIEVTRAGVRQGLLHDMLLLPRGEDRKQVTLASLMERHRVDRAQVKRVRSFALSHLDDIRSGLGMPRREAERLLRWAAALHEIGLTINYSGYHKHGAYIVRNSEMAGFTRLERARLAFLILNHRKRIKLEKTDANDRAPLPLLFLFRLAWLLHRTRIDRDPPVRELAVNRDTFTVVIEPGWLEHHPLVARQLERERERWREVGVELAISEHAVTRALSN